MLYIFQYVTNAYYNCTDAEWADVIRKVKYFVTMYIIIMNVFICNYNCGTSLFKKDEEYTINHLPIFIYYSYLHSLLF